MPTYPTQPATFTSPYSPPTGGTLWSLPSGGDLQTTINNAQPGDIIELAAGVTWTGPYILRNKGASQRPIYIRTTGMASIPLSGTRVSPSNASAMARVICGSGTSPAFQCDGGAHHWRLIGLEIASTNVNQTTTGINVVALEKTGGNAVVADCPNNITIDRCYIHGTTTGNVRRGILLNGSNLAVQDCYISDFHEVATDAQGVAGWSGPGPIMVLNCYIAGAAANVLFGGTDAAISALAPSDILIANNLIEKPLTWYPSDPTYAGVKWQVKNLLDFQCAKRVRIDGNVLRYGWLDAQEIYSIRFTPKNQGAATWSEVSDVTFQNNRVSHIGGGVLLQGGDSVNTSQPMNRVWILKNVFEDVSLAWSDVAP